MRRSRFTIFISLLVLVLLLGFLHIRGILKPAESALSEVPRPFVYVMRGTGHSIGSFFQYFSTVRSINKENTDLTAEVRSLQQDNVILQQYQIENEQLRKELDFRSTSQLSFISASVIAKDPTGFSQSVIINAGSRQGVQNGAAVLAQGVFIGKISEVDDFTATVLLVTDPQSSIDAQISGTDERGILRGSYGSGITLDLISQTAQLIEGEQVVTAGLTNALPKGLLIGTIGIIQSTQNDLLQKVTILSSTDLGALQFVSVVKQ